MPLIQTDDHVTIEVHVGRGECRFTGRADSYETGEWLADALLHAAVTSGGTEADIDPIDILLAGLCRINTHHDWFYDGVGTDEMLNEIIEKATEYIQNKRLKSESK